MGASSRAGRLAKRAALCQRESAGRGCDLGRGLGHGRRRLGLIGAQVDDGAAPAFGSARLAGVAAMQDQPVVRIATKRRRHQLVEFPFDHEHGLARREASAVGDAKDVCVDGEGFRTKGAVHDDIGGLASDPGQRFERGGVGGHFAVVIGDQRTRQRDDVLCLGVEQPDRLDVRLEPVLAERDHLGGRFHLGEQRARRLVDADVGRLRRQDDRDEQLEVIGEFKFGDRIGIGFGQAREEFENGGLLHRPSTSSIE